MADYRGYYPEIRAAGADVIAVSVDPPEKSIAVRCQLQLPFDVLCDIDHHVVREWDIYNPKEKGGIAKPATFILDPGRVVRLASVDQVAKRIAASEVTEYLRRARAVVPGRRSQFPHLSDFVRAIRNSIRYGLRS